MNKRTKIALILALLLGFITIFAITIGHALIFKERIYPGVRIEQVDVGGLTMGAAASKVSNHYSAREDFKLRYAEDSWTVPLDTIGAKVKARASAEQAYSVGRSSGFFKNFLVRYGAWSAGEKLTIAWSIDSKKTLAMVREMAKTIDLPELDAQLLIDQEEIRVQPHQVGITTDATETLRRIKGSLGRNRMRATVSVRERLPEKTTESIKALKIEAHLAEFSTKLSTVRNNRRANISLASATINDTYVGPGETFSFNEIVGPRSVEAGFLTAPVISGGNLVPGIGGGICQVATTLYNAAMISGLPIVERTVHSNYISSYPDGRDATVVDGLIDLKFRNDTEGTLLIKGVVLEGAVVFKVYGPKTGRVNTFSDPVVSNMTAFGTKTETDTSLPTGVTVRKQSGVAGRTIRVTRTVKKGEEILIQETAVSRYVPRQEILKVGPAPPPEPEPSEDPPESDGEPDNEGSADSTAGP